MNTFFISKRIFSALAIALFFVIPTGAFAWDDSGCCEYSYSDPVTYSYSDPITYSYTSPVTYSYSDSNPVTYSYSDPITYSYSDPITYSYYDYTDPVTYDYTYPTYTGGGVTYTSPGYSYNYTYPGYTYNPPTYTPPVYTPITPTPTTHSPICSLSVSDSEIERGDTVTLRWDNSHASRMTIDDSRGNRITSDTSSSGSIRISPTRTTTYTMTVRGTNGDTTNCSRSVSVDTDTSTNSNAPVCHIRVSDTVIRRGMAVLLTWDNSSNSREMYIKDSNGNRVVESSSDSGRYTVIPSRDTTYTMRVSNSHGSDTCSVSVDVRDTAVTTGGGVTVDRVPLAQVPYTGFDAGPYLTTLFYLLLGAWAVAIAYYVMRRKYGVDVVATATPVAPVVAKAPVVAQVATAPVAGLPMNLPTDAGFAELFGTPATDAGSFSIAQHAASLHVFITDEVVAMIAQAAQTPFAQKAYFDAMVAKARGKYPTEHGWLTIDSTRAAELH